FFTHYLVSALRGAADDNDDHLVTLGEAFHYARDQTILASSRTLAGTQHPTFHYDLRGRSDVTLTELALDRTRGTLTVPDGASWLVVRDGPSPSVVGEISASSRRRTLTVRPGRYILRGRAADALLEGAATVVEGARATVDPARLDRTTYAHLVRKGRGDLL